MKRAVLRGHGLIDNIIFDRSNIANRDNCFAPYALLKERFHEVDIELETSDQLLENVLAFELHQDVQPETRAASNYLLIFETPLIKAVNWEHAEWGRYRKIFTWNDALVDGVRFIKMNFPNPMVVPEVDGGASRDRFCCLIAGNKTLATGDVRNLYPERVKAIRWFEQHALQDFDLFGIGWNMPVLHRGLAGKIERRIFGALDSFVKLRPFPSYRGRVEHKRDVLMRTRFAICYENVRDLPGYITEKIFDCFFSGCVPVYWGANNITDHIPADCFIDRREFSDTAAVYAFLKTITDQEFRGYQQRIVEFLQSDAAYPFSSEYFAETIVSTIVQDIGTQA